jgi:hypothetical protein
MFVHGEVAESGRLRLIRNQVYPQGYRGFESLPLRPWTMMMSQQSRPAAVGVVWRDAREAEGARLEIVCAARYRGFESLSLRKLP